MAIYRKGEKVIFFAQVPPAGNTSVDAHLRRRFGTPVFYNPEHFENPIGLGRVAPQHLPSDLLSRLFPKDFFDHRFALILHPETRLKRAFLFHSKVQKTIPEDTDFGAFLEQLRRPRIRNKGEFDSHFRPQSELVPEGATIFRHEAGVQPLIDYIDDIAEFDGAPTRIDAVPEAANDDFDLTPSQRDLVRQIYAADFARFGYEPTRAAVRARTIAPKGAIRFALKTMVTSYEKRSQWGDWHFAASLAQSLEKRGHEVRIDCVPDWGRDPEFADVNVSLCGTSVPPKSAHALDVAWVLYPGRKPRHVQKVVQQLGGQDAILLATNRTETFDFKGVPVSPMLQAFDPAVMHAQNATHDGQFVFVGSNFPNLAPLRPIVQMAVDAGVELDLYGPGYKGTDAQPFVRGERVPNADLGDLYRSARAVLCDHIPAMVQNGFISNRIFDALACGAPVICDAISGLPEEFQGHVFPCETVRDLRDAVESITNETDQVRAERAMFAEEFMRRHSFDARASEIEDLVRTLLASVNEEGV